MDIPVSAQIVISFAGGLLAAALQMIGRKLLGVAVFVFSLGLLWWTLVPLIADKGLIDAQSLSLWIGGGWVAFIIIGLFWAWAIVHFTPTTSLGVHTSSTNQSGGVTAHIATISNFTINPPPGKPETIREVTDALAVYFREGKALLRKYETASDVPGIEAKKWSQKVARYLESTLGSAYGVYFEDTNDEPQRESGIQESILAIKGVSRRNRKVHRYLSLRLSQLREIMKELMKGGN